MSTVGAVVRAAGSDGFLGVDWSSIALVLVVGFVASVAIVSCYSLGLRLLAAGRAPAETGADDSHATSSGQRVPLLAAAGVFFTIAGAAVLYGIYLIVPQFH